MTQFFGKKLTKTLIISLLGIILLSGCIDNENNITKVNESLIINETTTPLKNSSNLFEDQVCIEIPCGTHCKKIVVRINDTYNETYISECFTYAIMCMKCFNKTDVVEENWT